VIERDLELRVRPGRVVHSHRRWCGQVWLRPEAPAFWIQLWRSPPSVRRDNEERLRAWSERWAVGQACRPAVDLRGRPSFSTVSRQSSCSRMCSISCAMSSAASRSRYRQPSRRRRCRPALEDLPRRLPKPAPFWRIRTAPWCPRMCISNPRSPKI